MWAKMAAWEAESAWRNHLNDGLKCALAVRRETSFNKVDIRRYFNRVIPFQPKGENNVDHNLQE